ncbi:hypothetical protein FQ087_02925 [Sporosarcina sp. ANT_H38]|uniref:hypothetical protein n=1 Tax=Sporosarcina sp. ANT_H38 TaxID=2597358 RepID=UPI0011F32663|nr:hypothetical protein [Sporosarcina sp. ANT_H38]KAA0965278.1 hypothetical protein FQ087_02925 [Sporosarcina sp. ANT_H38]
MVSFVKKYHFLSREEEFYLRKNQVSISINRFGDEAKNGSNKQTIKFYCDSNNIWEALASFYEAASEIIKVESLPNFGRRESYKEKILTIVGEDINFEEENLEGNRQSLYHIKDFKYDQDPIKFLLENSFRIEWDVFAKGATESEIEKIKERMPNGSQLHLDLKEVANKAIYPNGSTRGISYDFLVRVVSGFSSMWDEEN